MPDEYPVTLSEAAIMALKPHNLGRIEPELEGGPVVFLRVAVLAGDFDPRSHDP